MTDAEKEILKALQQRLETSLSAYKAMAEMPDAARVAAGLPIEPEVKREEAARIRALEVFTADVKTTVAELVLTTSNACGTWIDLLEAGAGRCRISCELPPGHEGAHRKQLVCRVEKQRIDAEVTWQMAPYLQAL